MPGEVFRFPHDGVVGVQILSLCSLNISQPHLPCQIWIFAKVFFDPSPTWIAGKVQHWSKNHVDASRACLCGNRGCWETLASNRAGVRYYAEFSKKPPIPFDAAMRLIIWG